MNVLKAITLAEIRHAELLDQAEQHRRARLAAGSIPGNNIVQRRLTVRGAMTAVFARVSAMRRRQDPMKPTEAAPA